MEKPPGRPIVSGVGDPLERIDKYLDKRIKHLNKVLPSFVLDSAYILWKLLDLTTPELAGADVKSLYSSIPLEVGVHVVSIWPDTQHPLAGAHNKFLIELLELVLNKNVFLYIRKYYRQKRGVVMGATCAPSYACLHLGWWEKEEVYTHPSLCWACSLVGPLLVV